MDNYETYEPEEVSEKTNFNNYIVLAILCLVIGAGAIASLTYLGVLDGFMTDGQCEDLLVNASNLGASYGMEYAIASIIEEAIQCNQIPINYQNNGTNYSYSLIAVECLNLNNMEDINNE